MLDAALFAAVIISYYAFMILRHAATRHAASRRDSVKR